MHLLIINPNSTVGMTQSIAAAAREVARPETVITAINPDAGPPAIQGHADGEAALPHLFELFDAEVTESSPYNAVIVACFDDTGLWELRQRSPVPVIGIGEAGFLAASLMGTGFSVITTLAVSLPVLEANITRYGFKGRCIRIRASGVPVLDFETSKDTACKTIAAEVETAIREDAPAAIVLGCAGMADLASDLTQRFGVPIVDGVAAAVGFCEALGQAVPAMRAAIASKAV